MEFKNLFKLDYMNVLEKEFIFKICEQYAEICYLGRNKFIHTNATEHTIK